MVVFLNFFCGFFFSILCDWFGCCKVVLIGVVLLVSGLFFMLFVIDLYYMYIIYGLFWGVGLSFLFVFLIVILGDYFDKRLVLVNGVGISGSGVGLLIVLFIINYFLWIIGWKNFFCIFSGVVVFFVVVCFFYRLLRNVKCGSNYVIRWCSRLCDVFIWKNGIYLIWVLMIVFF